MGTIFDVLGGNMEALDVLEDDEIVTIINCLISLDALESIGLTVSLASGPSVRLILLLRLLQQFYPVPTPFEQLPVVKSLFSVENGSFDDYRRWMVDKLREALTIAGISSGDGFPVESVSLSDIIEFGEYLASGKKPS